MPCGRQVGILLLLATISAIPAMYRPRQGLAADGPAGGGGGGDDSAWRALESRG
jgi:hypothetical protein